ncbi:MAG: DUF1476 family protein [Alphaproteobacteria bacterium]|nr:DUF1476 family protein [Alphaproteobacteria bacterium]
MTSLDIGENYFELRYVRQIESGARVKKLRNLKFANYVAQLIGLKSVDEIESYTSGMINRLFEHPGDQSMIEDALHDLNHAGIPIHEKTLTVELQNCEKKARSELSEF